MNIQFKKGELQFVLTNIKQSEFEILQDKLLTKTPMYFLAKGIIRETGIGSDSSADVIIELCDSNTGEWFYN